MNKLGSCLVGASGEYYVCAEICRRGYHAILGQKNNPLFDVIAVNKDGNKSVAIQVKTRSPSNNEGWKISSSFALEKHDDLFVVLVNIKESGGCEYYVCKHSVVADKINQVYRSYMEKPRIDGSAKKDVDFCWINDVDVVKDKLWISMKNNWDIITDALK